MLKKNYYYLHKKYLENIWGNLFVNKDIMNKMIFKKSQILTWPERHKYWNRRRTFFYFKNKIRKIRKKRFSNKTSVFFNYSISHINHNPEKNKYRVDRKRRSLYYYLLNNKIKFKYFYNITESKIIQLKKKYKKNWIIALESTIYMLMFRCNLSTSIKKLKNIIKYEGVLINGILIKDPYYMLKKGDSFNFSNKKHIYLSRFNIYKRTRFNTIYKLKPSYIYINYTIMYILLYKHITMDTIYYPLKLNLIQLMR